MDFPDVLRRFDAHMDVSGTSDRTRHAYRRELTNLWCDYLYEVDVSILDLSPHQLRAYVVGLPANGSKRGDVLRAVKAFYRFALGDGLVERDPSSAMPVPRAKAGPVPDLPEDQARRLLRAAFRRERRRGWAMLLVLHTGARVASLAALRPSDVDVAARLVYFAVAKGNRPYTLPLNRPAYVAAMHLIAIAETAGKETLIGVGPAMFRQWVHAAEQTAGLPRVWPHLLRHAFSRKVARKAVRSGNLDAWRRSMNHADLSQFPRYNPAPDDAVRDVLGG